MLDWLGYVAMIGEVLPKLVVFLPLFGLFASVFCACWFITASYEWINSLRPAMKFHALTDEINEARNSLLNDNSYGFASSTTFMGSSTKTLLNKLIYKLDKFHIPHPPISDAETWYHWLPELEAAASGKRLDEAQKELDA